MTESAINQYAPPRAQVADIAAADGVAELRLFSHRGRIGRLRYLAYTTTASLLYFIALNVLALSLGETALVLATIPLVAAVLWFSSITGIKRCHDLNISGWWTLTSVVPLIAFIWVFAPGSKGENRFGPPPPPNTLGVKLLGCILPVVFFVGMFAAIALPAYLSYTAAARAAQTAGPR